MGGICSLFKFTEAQEEIVVKSMEIPIVWILGGPGSGKTTMAHKLCERYKFTYVSMGDLISQEVMRNSKVGKEILAHMGEGKLVSRDVLFGLIQHFMAVHASFSQGYCLDGYPREIEQRIDLESKVSQPSLIFYLKCSSDTMKDRMYRTEEAPDSTTTILEARKFIYRMLTKISNYHKFAKPVVDEYPDQRRVITIDAEGDKMTVYVQLRRHMDILIRKLKRDYFHVEMEEELDLFL